MLSAYQLHTALAVWSLIVGVFLCTVYDLFRLFGFRRRQSRILLFVSDLVFCLIATASMLLLFFNLSYGRMRAYAFVLVIVGFLIWRFTVGRVLFSAMQRLLTVAEGLLNSLKIRAKHCFAVLVRWIYTKSYCKANPYRSIKRFKRKEYQNGAKDTDTH